MQTKLTLSLDPSVVSRAKRYAKQHDISISQMVETYLDLVTKPPVDEYPEPPVLRSLRGILKGANPRDYRKHLVGKYL